MSCLIPDWQLVRSQLNHDWLKNEFMRHLIAFIGRLNHPEVDEARLRDFVEKNLPKWQEKKKEFDWVIEHFETEMSPRTYLSKPPLNNLTDAERAWLGELVHLMWKNRYPVDSWVASARTALTELADTFAELDTRLVASDTVSVDTLRQTLPVFRNLLERSHVLSERISAFPHRVLVT